MQKNQIQLAGHLAAKVQLRYLPSGTKVANARLGETQRFKDRGGAIQSHTNWHSLVFYDQIADVALTYEQGENVYVEGSLQQRKFTPADGITRTVHEIVVRSCHLIEPARISNGRESEDDEKSSYEEAGSTYDAEWPVGPA